MSTIIQITSNNFNGQYADITFYPCSGGSINLGYQLLPYDYAQDNYEGTYDIYLSAYTQTCQLVISCPSPTPTTTSTPTPTPTPSVFTPASISDLVGWFDAGQGVTTTLGKVNTWDDLSNTMGDFTYSTGTKADYNSSGFGTNNLSYIHGYNGGTYITTSNWPTTTASTVYIICSFYQTIGGAYQRYMEQSGYGTGFIFLDASSGGNDEVQFGFTTNLSAPYIDPTINTPSVLRAKWNGSTNLIKLNNGTEISTGSVLASQPSNPLYMFNAANTNFGAGFDVAEIIIYNKVLNGTETTNLENYISTKYGITL